MFDTRFEPLVTVCRVERGLYALRYLEAGGEPFPRADIAAISGDVAFALAPGRDRAELASPGETIVVIAERPSAFELRVNALAGGTTDAKFNLDLLDAGVSRPGSTSGGAEPRWARDSNRSPGDARAAWDDGAVSVVGHVSRRGDVAVGAHEWLAGPDEVLPIEGLAISSGRRDVSVRLRVQSMRGDRQWSRWFEAGEFAGSRQQADPLTAIALALTGDAAAQYEIGAEIMTLGSAPQAKTGQVVEFFGIDPVVGFRFELNPVTEPRLSSAARPAAPLRVYRAKR